jgi:uncharacterized protein YdhG (YjbR/CyaY superfamily)
MDTQATDIDGYLAALPEAARATLAVLRATIRATAPEAVESISYGMPAFKYRGKPLAYFMAAKQHCALYGTAGGTKRFAPGEPLPEALVTALIQDRMADIEAKEAAGRRRKPGAEPSA